MKTKRLFARYNLAEQDEGLTPRARAELRRLVPDVARADQERATVWTEETAGEAAVQPGRSRGRRLVPAGVAAALVVGGGVGYALFGPGTGTAAAAQLPGEVVDVALDAYGTSATFSVRLDDLTGQESYLVFKAWTKDQVAGGEWAEVGDEVTLVKNEAGAYVLHGTDTIPFDISLVLAESEAELDEALGEGSGPSDAEDAAIQACAAQAAAEFGLDNADGAVSSRIDSPTGSATVMIPYEDSGIWAGVNCPALAEVAAAANGSAAATSTHVGVELGVVVGLEPVGQVNSVQLGDGDSQFYAVGATGTDEAELEETLEAYTLVVYSEEADGSFILVPDMALSDIGQGEFIQALSGPAGIDPAGEQEFSTVDDVTAVLEELGLLDQGYTIQVETEITDLFDGDFPSGVVVDVTCLADTKVCTVLTAP
ncbi:MAG: hypothetical protein LBR27_05715 [Bifidobacteriaceae bacterium]|jgi:hypothetical protein|nr:hypothetical protein [Bifidobacteriaceae bacterium]